MKHKLAIFASSWVKDIVNDLLKGVKEYCSRSDMDIFVFNSHALSFEEFQNNIGELHINHLPDLKDFDGVIVVSNILNCDDAARELCRRAEEDHVPCISISLQVDGAAYCEIDNRAGMRILVEHLVEEHGVKRVKYIAGTKDHKDSNERFETIQEVMGEHGYPVTERGVFYSNWSFSNIIPFVDELLASDDPLPDAILCANDLIALATISELSSRKIQVPRDVIVTGYDFIADGRHYYPALTTVSQDYYKVGYECCRTILEESPIPLAERKIVIRTRFIEGESCGCQDDFCFETLRREFCQNMYSASIRADLLRINERNFEIKIAHSRDYKELKKNIEEYYRDSHLFEGKDFAIAFDKNYFSDLLGDEKGLHLEDYGEKLEILFAMKDGEVLHQEEVDRHELFPGYEKGEGASIYNFIPIYEEKYTLGYMVVKGETLLIKTDQFFNYVQTLKHSLIRLRINMRLDTLNADLTEIYNIDPMTGLYNRFVMDETVIPVFEECKKKNEIMAIFFVDINYMKKINDRFGHLRGDEAIRIIAKSIHEILKENWMGVRYGGDEFLIIAPNADKEAAEAAKRSLTMGVDSKAMMMELPYHLGISIGYVITEPESGKNFEDYIKMADDVMYEIKRELHAKD